jgi:hypothetical protein
MWILNRGHRAGGAPDRRRHAHLHSTQLAGLGDGRPAWETVTGKGNRVSLDRRIREVVEQLRAGGAVAVLGAGVSGPAGLPLSPQQAPHVWQALDENLVVRAEVASELGRPDVSAKALVSCTVNSLDIGVSL